jgi:membrane-bound metal-dependent hydrolase YbcI (DUF457 family)
MLANVVIDFEPGVVLLFGLIYPAHGYCHTFLLGTLIGLVWGLLAYPARNPLGWLMKLFGLPYWTSLGKMVLSGVLGVWFHVLLDSFCWGDIRPFWPIGANPLYNLTGMNTVRLLCVVAYIPAVVLYIGVVIAHRRKRYGATS